MTILDPTLTLVAIDPSTIFTAVFLIVMFLGWVMQAVQNQNAPPQKRGPGAGNRPRPRPRPRDDRVAAEIDAFLAEVDDRDEPEIEIVREPPRRRPQRQQRPPVRREPTQQRERPSRTRPEGRGTANAGQSAIAAGSSIDQHANDLGQGLRTHVSSYMANNMEQEVDSHLGDRRDEMPAERTTDKPPHPLIASLRSPQGMRQAILLSEVLAKPRVLRDQ